MVCAGRCRQRKISSPSAGVPTPASELPGARSARTEAGTQRATPVGPEQVRGKHRLGGVSSDTPPVAKKVPAERTHHGDTVVDDYAWLTDKDDPDTVAYLEAENAYTEARTAHLRRLRETIFQEIKARTLETDLSVPTRKGGWWYYARTDEGKQYGIQCRVAGRRARRPPELERRRAPLAGRAGAARRQRAGRRHRLLLARHLRRQPRRHPARLLRPTSPATSASPCGSRTSRTGESGRRDPRHLLRRRLVGRRHRRSSTRRSTTPGGPTGSGGTRSAPRPTTTCWSTRRPTSGSGSASAHPQRALPRARRRQQDHQRGAASSTPTTPTGEFAVVAAARDRASSTRVDHAGRPVPDPAQRRRGELRAGRAPRRRPGRVDAADRAPRGHPAARRRRVRRAHRGVASAATGSPASRVLPADGDAVRDRLRRADLHASARRATRSSTPARLPARLHLAGHARRRSTTTTSPPRELILLKQQPVLGGYDPADYEQYREWATAAGRHPGADLASCARQRHPRTARRPPCSTATALRDVSIDPWFSVARLRLLDRGFVFAVAHVRGGGEMGRRWYEDGKLLRKKNTFTDFVAARPAPGQGRAGRSAIGWSPGAARPAAC